MRKETANKKMTLRRIAIGDPEALAIVQREQVNRGLATASAAAVRLVLEWATMRDVLRATGTQQTN